MVPVLGPWGNLLRHLCQPHWPWKHLVEVVTLLLLLVGIRGCIHLLLLPGDPGSHT